MIIEAPVSVGELLDKITILEIKKRRLTDPEKQRNVALELSHLRDRWATARIDIDLSRLVAELEAVNEQLWEIEDAIRECERRQDFGQRFIDLARSVYRTNDRRAELKRAINDATGSTVREEKCYAAY